MCLSPEVDVLAGAAITGIGVATLLQVREKRDLIIGALPLGFGLHQLNEAFVWWGLRGQVSAGIGDAARDIYVGYAQVVLPIVVPLGFALLERDPKRRRFVWPFAVLGLVTGLFLLWHLIGGGIVAQERDHCVAYVTTTPHAIPSATAYILAVCAPALLSSRRHLRLFGLVNIVGIAIAATMQEEEFTSVWCLYAAVMSWLIWLHFRGEARAVDARRSATGDAGRDPERVDRPPDAVDERRPAAP